MKKFFICILTFLFLITPTFAQNVENKDVITKTTEISEVSVKLRKEIKEAIIDIYGEEQSDGIFDNVLSQVQKAIQERPAELLRQDYERKSDWYKNEIIYMFYVDQFGVVSDKEQNTFKDTALMLDYLEDLGVTTLYMLPFADSPMKDAGFDVKNPQNIRKDLGGLVEFKDFIKKAKQRGFKIKADLVLNHFSDSHEWFQQLIKGNESYLDYFVYRETMPEYKKYQDEKIGTVIEYIEDNNTISKTFLTILVLAYLKHYDDFILAHNTFNSILDFIAQYSFGLFFVHWYWFFDYNQIFHLANVLPLVNENYILTIGAIFIRFSIVTIASLLSLFLIKKFLLKINPETNTRKFLGI